MKCLALQGISIGIISIQLYAVNLFVIILYGYQLNAQTTNKTYVLGRTIGKLTMLGYGLGEDRLGGAKMGYIDTGVLIKIIDSSKDQYVIQLSKLHTAYIGKNDIKIDTSLKLNPYYLTNSWSVKGDYIYDYVSISMDEKLPYKSWMEINPSKIMVDIYGVQSNTNWINSIAKWKVKNIYFNQVEDDVVRVTIELKHDQHWGYSIGYKQKTLSVTNTQATSIEN